MDKHLSSFGLRIAARRSLERLLRVFGLPPLCMKPLVVPACLLSRLSGIRRMVREVLEKVNNPVVKSWLLDSFRVIPGKKQRWNEAINCKGQFQKFDVKSVLALPSGEVGRLISMPTLQAYPGPWRLPKWPVQHSVSSEFRRSWKQWVALHRIPAKVARKGDLCWRASSLRCTFQCVPQAGQFLKLI